MFFGFVLRKHIYLTVVYKLLYKLLLHQIEQRIKNTLW